MVRTFLATPFSDDARHAAADRDARGLRGRRPAAAPAGGLRAAPLRRPVPADRRADLQRPVASRAVVALLWRLLGRCRRGGHAGRRSRPPHRGGGPPAPGGVQQPPRRSRHGAGSWSCSLRGHRAPRDRCRRVARPIPISFVFPLLVVSSILLEPRRLGFVLVVTAVVVAVWAPRSLLGPVRVTGVVIAVLVVMWLMYIVARSARPGRDPGARRRPDVRRAARPDRLGGPVPCCPTGWSATSCILSAHGDRFSGDFVVAHLSPSAHRLEFALVDVSGKGTRAGTRSLLLSGALGGLLGAVPSGRLPAGGQRLPRPPGLGRGLRHRRAPRPRPAHRRVLRRQRGPPGAGPLRRGTGPLVAARGRARPAARRGPGRPSRARPAGSRRATPSCSTPTASSRRAAATSSTASTGCSVSPRWPCSAAATSAARCASRPVRERMTTGRRSPSDVV